jgi:hypothetical protein
MRSYAVSELTVSAWFAPTAPPFLFHRAPGRKRARDDQYVAEYYGGSLTRSARTSSRTRTLPIEGVGGDHHRLAARDRVLLRLWRSSASCNTAAAVEIVGHDQPKGAGMGQTIDGVALALCVVIPPWAGFGTAKRGKGAKLDKVTCSSSGSRSRSSPATRAAALGYLRR